MKVEFDSSFFSKIKKKMGFQDKYNQGVTELHHEK